MGPDIDTTMMPALGLMTENDESDGGEICFDDLTDFGFFEEDLW